MFPRHALNRISARRSGPAPRHALDEMSVRKRILIVDPNAWDRLELLGRRDGWRSRYQFVLDEELDRRPLASRVRIDNAAKRIRARRVAGVASSSDYPGCILAAAL